MTVATHDEAVIAAFNLQEARFKDRVPAEDVRLKAVLDALGPIRGRRVLDLGCGKGRFAHHLRQRGAEVVGLDVSYAMLVRAGGLDRVRGSARRLPIADGSCDGVVAVEVFEHLTPRGVDQAIAEAARVLRPGGILAVVDKNAKARDARRPWLPSLAVKWIDERRGRWMYPPGGPAHERWFRPEGLRRRLAHHLERVEIEFLLSPDEIETPLFQRRPDARLLAIWTARKPGGGDV